MNTFDAEITFCHTRDLAETSRFYEDALGLKLALDQGGCRIYRVAGSAFLGFCSREDAPRPDSVVLTLVTEDVDEWHERLTERGVSVEQSPRRNPRYNIYHFFLRDPNGYLIEIQRFEDPRWKAR